jgi:hypothetical protein
MWKVFLVLAIAGAFAGCGTARSSEDGSGGSLNPQKEDGSYSQKFEPEDIERAEAAPQSVQEYCAGAVSEAQEESCLS